MWMQRQWECSWSHLLEVWMLNSKDEEEGVTTEGVAAAGQEVAEEGVVTEEVEVETGVGEVVDLVAVVVVLDPFQKVI
jgi:hypothetical protein